MTTLSSNAPYYDDFDEFKNYHQILFRPGYQVQARELTQLQTILKNQITKFGNHIFQQGSIVIPGNSFADLGVPCVKVESAYLGDKLNLSMFEGKAVTGQSSGVKAVVRKAVEATGTDPVTFYLAYTSGGVDAFGVPNGKLVFDDAETLQVDVNNAVRATTTTSCSAVGSLAHVNEGVYYVNGSFVSVQKQQVVISKYDVAPNCRVMLKIIESVVDSVDDETLLDPAQGSYNFAAPGADRHKIDLTLVKLDLTEAVTDDYIEIMRYEAGELVAHMLTPKYSELDKVLARRTFDESGNYIVNGFRPVVREHNRTLTNGGVYPNGDVDKFVYDLQPGRAYFNGYQIENLASRKVVADKARTASHVIQSKKTLQLQWGQYLTVQNPLGTLDLQNRQTVQLWNISQNTGGTQIGTAKVIGLDYLIGDGSANPIFKLFISDLSLTSGSYAAIGSIRTAAGTFFAKVVAQYKAPVTAGAFVAGEIINFNSGVRTATVSFFDPTSGNLWAHKHSATSTPNVGDTITQTSATSVIKTKYIVNTEGGKSLVFPLPVPGTKQLKTSTNNYDMEYTSWVVLSIGAGGTSSQTVTGRIEPIETGTFVALTNSGIDPISNYTLNGTGTVVNRNSAAPAGGVTIYCQLTKQGATPRTKSVASHSATYTAGTSVSLQHADVYEITSITHNGVDITSRYSLETGQTDYDYGISSLKIRNGYSTPVGQIVVQYKYFNHSVGDFFTIDSYPAGFDQTKIPQYKSPSDQVTYSLRDCIDFRKTVSIASNPVVPNTFISTSVQNYGGRYDVLCMDSKGDPIVVSGSPAITPQKPQVPTTLFAIRSFYIPPWTYSIEDITYKDIAVFGYSMTDISKIEDRISNLEDYTTLTASETQVANTSFIDAATGLDRFKTGYLVEDMTDPFRLADVTSKEFAAYIDYGTAIGARNEQTILPMQIENGSGQYITQDVVPTPGLISETSDLYVGKSYMITNGVISLPYYDKLFAGVSVSQRITNVNPFNVFKWEGRLSLSPTSDVWVERIDNPEIFNYVENIITTIIWVPRTPPAPAPAPIPVFGPGPTPAASQIIEPAPLPVPAPAVVPPVIPIAVPPAPVIETHWFEGGWWQSDQAGNFVTQELIQQEQAAVPGWQNDGG